MKSQQQKFSLGKTVYSPFAVKTTSELVVIRYLERTDIGNTVIQAGEFLIQIERANILLRDMLDLVLDILCLKKHNSN